MFVFGSPLEDPGSPTRQTEWTGSTERGPSPSISKVETEDPPPQFLTLTGRRGEEVTFRSGESGRLRSTQTPSRGATRRRRGQESECKGPTLVKVRLSCCAPPPVEDPRRVSGRLGRGPGPFLGQMSDHDREGSGHAGRVRVSRPVSQPTTGLSEALCVLSAEESGDVGRGRRWLTPVVETSRTPTPCLEVWVR